jgi:hypothetical protein
LTINVSSSIGVWKPCAPLQVMFLCTNEPHRNQCTTGGTDCMAMRVPSASKIKSCPGFSNKRRRNRGATYCEPVHDNRPLTLLNHVGKDAKGGGNALITTAQIHVSISTIVPRNVRSVDGVLNLPIWNIVRAVARSQHK